MRQQERETYATWQRQFALTDDSSVRANALRDSSMSESPATRYQLFVRVVRPDVLFGSVWVRSVEPLSVPAVPGVAPGVS